MTSRDFCYWLQGLFELSDPEEINKHQTLLIKKHLALVFKHEIDPSMGDENMQDLLNKIHNSTPDKTLNIALETINVNWSYELSDIMKKYIFDDTEPDLTKNLIVEKIHAVISSNTLLSDTLKQIIVKSLNADSVKFIIDELNGVKAMCKSKHVSNKKKEEIFTFAVKIIVERLHDVFEKFIEQAAIQSAMTQNEDNSEKEKKIWSPKLRYPPSDTKYRC